MEVVAEDLEQNGPRLSPLEGLIFRVEHRQIDLLAGLPLDFLGRAQLRWIVDRWRDVLAAIAGNYFQTGGHDVSDALLKATARLELFAFLLRERRDADRVTKRTPARNLDRLARRPPRDEFQEEYIRRNGVGLGTHPKEIKDPTTEPVYASIARADTATATYLTTRFCPICGGKIQLEEIIDATDPTQAQFWGVCPVCDTIKVYVANLNAMMGTR
jgi:hypothetical protein